jgi:hypothetical protein
VGFFGLVCSLGNLMFSSCLPKWFSDMHMYMCTKEIM